MFAHIPVVDSVAYAILKTNPPQHVISATGTVPTSGWTNARLTPYVYVTQPSDGIQDFGFISEAPTGPVLQVEQTISADWIGYLPLWAKGVRIRGATNFKEVMFRDGSDAECPGIELRGGEIPWPLAV